MICARCARWFGAIFGKILGDGKVRGCTLSYSGANLTIAKGHMVAKGRLIAFDNAETIASETTAANGYGRLKLSIDLSQGGKRNIVCTSAVFVGLRGNEQFSSADAERHKRRNEHGLSGGDLPRFVLQ